MGSWEVRGQVKGMCKSWRDISPELAAKVERIHAPNGRGIAWEGAEIWAYKDRPNNLYEVFRANVEKYPDKEAYIFYPGGERITWKEIGDMVNRLAYHLRHKFNIKKGDRLCLLAQGSPEFVTSYLAIGMLGGIAVPVNLGLSSEGIAAQINKISPKGLVCSPQMWQSKVSCIKNILNVEFVLMTGKEKEKGTIPFDELINDSVPEQVVEEIDEWDIFAISFTSGTTGAPKGTMAMHTNAAGNGQTLIDIIKLDSEDIMLCAPPLYHNAAVYSGFVPTLMLGATLVVMASFVPIEAVKIVEKERVTSCVAAPIMLWMMMNHSEFKNYDTSTLKKIAFGGHAASESFIYQLWENFSPVAAINGGSVSESTALGFALPTEDGIRKIASCGLATPNSEIALFDDTGYEITESNVKGEVAYKGQLSNAGYWENPERTKETFRKDGYVLSGDWAKIDEEGYLWLLDRKKDMIVRGGQNVYCIEIENKLYLYDKVFHAAAVGVPDHVFDERVKAVVVPKPGHTITPDEIRDHCAKHLTNYEVPEYVVFAKALPTNPAGKTLKPPLMDYWGDDESAQDKTLAVFKAYCASMPPKLLDLELLRLNNQPFTPRAALKEIEEGTELGKVFRKTIEEKGIIELLKPAVARFRF